MKPTGRISTDEKFNKTKAERKANMKKLIKLLNEFRLCLGDTEYEMERMVEAVKNRINKELE